MKAADFTLQDQNDSTRSLSDYAGKWVVIYFYPKDDTPGCTKEACSFRDTNAVFKEQGIEVVGISADSVASHKKFEEKYHLSFTLLSDPSKETIQAYGAWGEKNMYGKKYMGIMRKTFLVNPEGEIAKEYPKVTPDKHAEQILKDIAELKNS